MSYGPQRKIPVVLMVSGGSDSTALLELACAYVDATTDADDVVTAAFADMLPAPQGCALTVLHVNHLLRGADADADEVFVAARCRELGVPLEVRRIDVAAVALERSGGLEAVARQERYRAAEELLDACCAREGAEPHDGIICTAHTRDDRVETFYMRSLVGTGPGGFASIPRVRDRVRRPLLDATRAQLRDWLRARHPGFADSALWREDATNDDGSNFRSQVRTRLIPVLEELRPGFGGTLAHSMDLIADEDEGLAQQAESLVYRNVGWDGEICRLPLSVLEREPRYLQRRILRCCLLMVRPDARLESSQIEHVLDGLSTCGFVTETAGGIRVQITPDELVAHRAQ